MQNVINIDDGQPVTSEPDATFDLMAHLAKNAMLFSVEVHIPSFSKLCLLYTSDAADE